MIKKLWKKFYKTDAFAHAVGTLMMLYLWLVYYSSRKTYTGNEHVEKIWNDKNGIILCFWHSRLLMSAFAARPPEDLQKNSSARQAYVLTTRHRDGRYTAAMMRGLKGLPIYGSSSKRAENSLRESVRRLRERGVVVVTPDGPRGPAFQAAPGCVQMSRLADAWILPMAYSTGRKKILNSWDKLLWPWPMGHMHFCFGEPFKAKKFGTDIEAARLYLQEQLNTATQVADKACAS